MVAGVVNKNIGDGLGGTMSAKFLADNNNPSTGNLSPAPTLFDSAGAEVLGKVGDAAYTGTGTPGAMGFFAGIWALLKAGLPASLGQKASAASVPVALASDDALLVAINSLIQTVSAHPGFGMYMLDPATGVKVDITQPSPVTLGAGSALAGKFGIDQTTPGTTNGVQLQASAAVAGKFGIDHTTPGTTDAVVVTSPASINAAQATVSTTSGVVVAARAGRKAVTIINEGTTAVRLGAGTVTTAASILLPGVLGASITLESAAAINGIVASGTATVSFIETF